MLSFWDWEVWNAVKSKDQFRRYSESLHQLCPFGQSQALTSDVYELLPYLKKGSMCRIWGSRAFGCSCEEKTSWWYRRQWAPFCGFRKFARNERCNFWPFCSCQLLKVFHCKRDKQEALKRLELALYRASRWQVEIRNQIKLLQRIWVVIQVSPVKAAHWCRREQYTASRDDGQHFEGAQPKK